MLLSLNKEDCIAHVTTADGLFLHIPIPQSSLCLLFWCSDKFHLFVAKFYLHVVPGRWDTDIHICFNVPTTIQFGFTRKNAHSYCIFSWEINISWVYGSEPHEWNFERLSKVVMLYKLHMSKRTYNIHILAIHIHPSIRWRMYVICVVGRLGEKKILEMAAEKGKGKNQIQKSNGLELTYFAHKFRA